MDAVERKQIRLILEHLSETIRAQSIERQKAMHAKQAAAKLLKSGETVKASLRLSKEDARDFITKALDQSAHEIGVFVRSKD